MNNYLLQRLLCRNSIQKCAWLSKNLATVSSHPQSSTSSSKSEIKPEFNSKDWLTIYKFPYILGASRIPKLRRLQYIATVVACPASYALEHYQYISENMFLLTVNLSLSLCVTLTLCSLLVRRLVGFVYVDHARENMRLGYLTFDGKREDKVLKIEDVKTFGETQKFKLQLIKTVATYTDDTKYKLLEQGGILNRDEFRTLFGSD